MKHKQHPVPAGPIRICLFMMAIALASCDQRSAPPAFQDLSHKSKVFGREKTYRLYLPSGYEQGQERYPVIYFFHGWGGRYKSDDNAKLAYEKIGDLVNKYRVILVMWDGNMDEVEPRPYNIGNHRDVKYDVQMKDYFPELVSHIDSAYKTIPEKNNRGIIGFSMGGFMAYFLAGKYPDMIAAAVSMTGSPEFFVGYPGNHTLYPLRYTFKNLKEVKLRFHNSTADELTYLNTEVHHGAQWEGGLDFEYWQFVGGHVVDKPGETEVFEKAMNFVANAFNNPLSKMSRWSHYDLYGEFEVYDYKVKSDKREPGFIFLNRVSKNGFGISTHRWLPAGPPLSAVTLDITTAPLYPKKAVLNVIRLVRGHDEVLTGKVISDDAGRLHFTADQRGEEIGIYEATDLPDLICTDYKIDKADRLLRANQKNKLTLTLFNRGGDLPAGQTPEVVVHSRDSTVTVLASSVTVHPLGNRRIFSVSGLEIISKKKPPTDGSPAEVKLDLRISVGNTSFEDELTVPVFFDVPEFPVIDIDDGRAVNDTTSLVGKGNGDGKASPGEEIMVYTNGHRIRLYSDDPYVRREKEILVDEVLPAKWPDGFTLSSVITIADNCPEGHIIECVGSYETKGFMPIERRLTWGKIRIRVNK